MKTHLFKTSTLTLLSLSLLVGCAGMGAKNKDALKSDNVTLSNVKTILIVPIGDIEQDRSFGQALVKFHRTEGATRGYKIKIARKYGGEEYAPTFKSVEDVKKWIENGHKQQAEIDPGGFGGGGGNSKYPVSFDAVIVNEISRSDSSSFMDKAMNKLKPGMMKAGENENFNEKDKYDIQLTVFDPNGKVAMSLSDVVDKTKIEDGAGARDYVAGKQTGDKQRAAQTNVNTKKKFANSKDKAAYDAKNEASAQQTEQATTDAMSSGMGAMAKTFGAANAHVFWADTYGRYEWGLMNKHFPKR